MYTEILKELLSLKNEKKRLIFERFFKTKKGEYGEGDKFLGIDVPTLKKIAKKYKDIDFETLEKLISSKYHEVRFLSLNILVLKYEKNIEIEKDILDFYLRNVKYVNNWDLVDTSSYKIVGRYSFENKDKSLIKKFSRSDNIWERRIAVVSLYYFIKRKDCSFPLSVLKRLLNDREELLKKAIGWMLREICKNCGEDILEKFLIENYNILAPITVSYATERFSKEKRKRFLKGYRKKLHKH